MLGCGSITKTLHARSCGSSARGINRPLTRVRAEASSSTSTSHDAPAPHASSNGATTSSSTSSLDGGVGGTKRKVKVEKSRVKAVAAKIAAARELARRLAEEKQAAAAAAAKVDSSDGLRKRAAEEASVTAAAQAARADALARALRRAENGREQLQQLRSENRALRELLLELAADRSVAQARLAELRGPLLPVEDSGIFSSSEESQDPLGSVILDMPLHLPTLTEGIDAQQQRNGWVPAATAPRAPTRDELEAAAKSAADQGRGVFTIPAEPVPVGTRTHVYYDRTRGPLPEHCQLQLKAGPNAWESIEVLRLEREPLLAGTPGRDWWGAVLELPRELFRLDFVVQDSQSGAIDNNAGKDYSLSLSGALTQQELMEARAAQYEAAERARRAVLAAGEDKVAAEVEQLARAAAAEGRLAYRARREQELRVAAAAVVAERRPALLDALDMQEGRPGVFGWPAGPPRPGEKVLLAYNLNAGPFGWANGAKLHYGFDGWYQKVKQTLEMRLLTGAELTQYNLPSGGGTRWVGGWVDIPFAAACVDFVVSDPEERSWDNNAGRDFHTAVVGAASGTVLADMVLKALHQEASERDREGEERAAKAAAAKIQVKAQAAAKRRQAQQEFLYSMPLAPRAGQAVDIYYNPDLTVLRGRPDIFMRGSFNRWRHPHPIAPIRMAPSMPGAIGFLKATIQVPSDAHVIDVIFSDSDSNSGGFYDNNGGLDYHLPTEGASGTLPNLKVVHIAVEMAPIAKVGGMGDVVTALGRAVQEEGHDVEVIIPKFDVINYKLVENLHQDGGFAWGNTFVRVWRGVVEDLPTTFLEPENGMFWVGCIYGRNDDAARFAFFCGAATEYMKVRNVAPHIIHCHDWQTAPCAWAERGNARCVFTIHNLNYGADLIARAMGACQIATTVSPTYAREISGHQAIAPHLSKLFGIRNGIDPDIWDPSEDPFLPVHYGPEGVVEGKAAARRELRNRMSLAHMDVPVVAVVTRLVHQKGIHLIKHAAWRTLERGGQFVLLGSAPDPRVQGEFNALKEALLKQYPDRACLWFAYDEPLSHLIYAGCDMFLVPSIFEPCGLTQMIAMRYGTVPVVRKTGGLNDTVFDVDHDEDRALALGLVPNGFSFEGTDQAGLDYALNRALSAWYNDREWWNALCGRIMTQDWSWSTPALDYIELYYKAQKSIL